MGLRQIRVGVHAMLILCAVVTGAGAGQDDAEADPIRLATRTLSEHLGVTEQSVNLDEVIAVDWRDSSLGCPETGRMYATVVTSGYRVTLVVGDETHRVHVAGTRATVCERTAEPIPTRGPGPAVVGQARQHLAARLGLDETRIRVASIERRSWPNAGLGCPEPGHLSAEVITDGFLIELEADGRLYRYHTDEQTVRLCADRRPV